MTSRSFILALVGAAVGLIPHAASAGNIVGTVRAQGTTAPANAEKGGVSAYSSRKYKFAERIDYDRLRDFIVYIDQDVPGGAKSEGMVVQKDVSFEPHVLPIAVGTTVRWPNEDDIYHNVFSVSEGKQFNLGYYSKERVPAVLFDRVGRVDVFCGIHSNMHCIILVLPNTHFARADTKGRFALKDLPPGTYHVKAWHERLPAQTKDVVVPADGDVNLDFVLSLGDLPPP